MKKNDEPGRGISREYCGTMSYEGLLLYVLLLYSPDFPNTAMKMLYLDNYK
jgi:hypothetical protein